MPQRTLTAADPARHRAPAPTRTLCVGGLTPFTTLDYPGQLAAVVFVQGCPWRCTYCHNPHLQARERAPGAAPSWPDVRAWLQRRVGLLDAVVFSGGEPTLDAALPQAMREARALGLRVGLHTAGIYPQRLREALPLADWVGLDVKAPLAASAHSEALHTRITGVPGSAPAVRESLALLRASGVAHECRTTAHPALLDDADLLALAAELAAAGVAHWAVQIFRNQGCAAALPPVPAGYPATATLAALRERLAGFVLRRE